MDQQAVATGAPLGDAECPGPEWRRLRWDQLAGRLGVSLVAQDVEAVPPELVQTDAEGYKRVDYSRLTAVLVQAVNEQQAVIDGLAARLAVLEREPGRGRATPPASPPPVEGAR